MLQDEFTKDLPETVSCECCRKTLSVDWGIGRIGLEWIGIGICKCKSCEWVKIAAAGSDEISHREAQALRMKLMVHMERPFFSQKRYK